MAPELAGMPHIAVALDGRVQHVHLGDIARLPLEHAAPARSFPAWRGKRNYEGQYWSTSAGSHVGFESLYEKTALMVLDRDASVVGISSQPMWLFWPEGRSMRAHAPDFFVRLASGDGVVVDVRPAERIDTRTAEVFVVTSELCAEAGLGYRVMSELSQNLARNLRFLSRFRFEEFHPASEQLERIATQVEPAPLGEWAPRFDVPAPVGLGWVYALLWWGALEADLDVVLTVRSLVWRRGEG